MIAVVQRVTRARVESDGEELGAIGPGMLVLLCAVRGDTETETRRLAERIARFRFFPDAEGRMAGGRMAEGRMNVSALDRGLEVLVVSQFTLSADGRRGRRPSFDRALPPIEASKLCDHFVAIVRELGLRVETGRFGAQMQVELVNDGPVTFLLEEAPEDPSETLEDGRNRPRHEA